MEHSSGIILFRKQKEQREYLLLKSTYINPFWGFSKGHIEEGETEKETALREAAEETGLKEVVLIPQFQEKISYFKTVDGKKVFKEVTWFLGEVAEATDGKVSKEHEELRWLSYAGAFGLLTFDKEKKLLKKVEDFLSSKSKNPNRSRAAGHLITMDNGIFTLENGSQ